MNKCSNILDSYYFMIPNALINVKELNLFKLLPSYSINNNWLIIGFIKLTKLSTAIFLKLHFTNTLSWQFKTINILVN